MTDDHGTRGDDHRTATTPRPHREGHVHHRPEEARGKRSVPLNRRDYLRSVGVAGAAGLLGAAGANSATAQSGWETEADQRIQENRTGDLEVVVQDQSGNAVPNASVSVEMQEHDYGFGTMIHAEFLTRATEWGQDYVVDGRTFGDADQQQYRDTVDELFNMVVLENLHKWLLWEENTQIADEAVQWAVDHGKDVRGHVCLWGNVDAWAVPPDVVEAMGVSPNETNFEHDDFNQANHDPDYVVQRSMEHLETIISHYGDDILEWDVVNEVIHVPDMIEAVDGAGVDAATAPILGQWYQRAEEVADQYGVQIAVNDYSVLAGNYGSEQQNYRRQIDYLVNDVGVDLDGIGFQCHFSGHETITPNEVFDILDFYSGYGARFRATEYDTFDGWGSEQEQADYLYQFLKTWYSHPETDAFLMWGHWDAVHWGPDAGGPRDAPLFDDDWNPKPAYDSYTDLVFDQWWTSESGTTDGSGTYTTSAFLGEHEITVSSGGQTTTQQVSVTDASGTTRVTVTLGDTPGCEGIQVGEYCATDPNGDGEYTDVNGNGGNDFDDVVTFFEEMNSSGVQNNVSAFDFNDNGGIDFDDVVALFGEV